MAIASIMVGVLVGIISFILALTSGYGIFAAAGFYVLGGLLSTGTLMLAWVIRGVIATPSSREGQAVARG